MGHGVGAGLQIKDYSVIQETGVSSEKLFSNTSINAGVMNASILASNCNESETQKTF